MKKFLLFIFLLLVQFTFFSQETKGAYSDAECKAKGNGAACTLGGTSECPSPYESLGDCTNDSEGKKRACCGSPKEMTDSECKEKGGGVGFCSLSDGSCSTSSGEVTLGKCSNKRDCCAPANWECLAKNGSCKSKDIPSCTPINGISCEKANEQCCENSTGEGGLTDEQCSGKGSGARCISGSPCAFPYPRSYGTCVNSRVCCAPEDSTPTSPTPTASFKYTLLESIPGQGNSSDFPSYIKALYLFTLSAVGIAALLMVIIGGYFYVTSAGNSSLVTKGKGLITDAILGIVVAFASWLVLYIINPDLVEIDLGSLGSLAVTGGSMSSFQQSPTQQALSSKGKAACQESTFKQQVQASASKYNIDAKLLQSILVGGEGCDKRLSTDGFGSCGYSQALPGIRSKCGITGTASETCAIVQNDLSKDLDCAAWLIADNKSKCGLTCSGAASCYNSGKSDNCPNTTNHYCDRVCAYYSST